VVAAVLYNGRVRRSIDRAARRLLQFAIDVRTG
jgi:hypothetical protein